MSQKLTRHLRLFLLTGFYLVKIFLISCIGLLFKNYDVAKLTVFFTMLYDKFLGIVLFPIVILIHFFIYDISDYMMGFHFFIYNLNRNKILLFN